MATVTATVLLTKSFGDFNSLKVGMEVTDEVPETDGESRSDSIRNHYKRLYDLASSEVDRKMSEAIRELS